MESRTATNVVRVASAWALLACFAAPAVACPFCTAVGPSLVQRCEASAAAALGEVSATARNGTTVKIHRALCGAARLANVKSVQVPAGSPSDRADAQPQPKPLPTGTLVLLLGSGDGNSESQWAWEVVPVSELAYAYLLRAPATRVDSTRRLEYFARYLEHRDPLVAEDAYLEFGHAPFDQVAKAAEHLPMESIRRWIVDPRTPDARRGFYGLALGLAKEPADRAANEAVLEKLAHEPADDFRAGYDGVLGGYLLLGKERALAEIERRILANRQARPGDVRHALTALRFYREFGGDGIPDQRQRLALRRVLDQPDFAADAIVDLARWQDWDSLDAVVALFKRQGYAEPATSRAVVGYLLACPEKRAAKELARLRTVDPRAVRQAEAQLEGLGTGR